MNSRFLVTLSFLCLLAPRLPADCGSVPFAPFASHSIDITSTEIKFDPLKVSVFEPRQRAVILWNGKEEILLLSTDQRASQPSAVLEVIPLPGRPTIKLGDFKTFEVAQELVINKQMWACAHGGARAELAKSFQPAARIDFAEKLGAHDLTVAEVLDKTHFVAFIQDYLKTKYKVEQAPIRPEFLEIIEQYLNDDFRWFAFDVIELSDKNGSRRPIEYRFASDSIYYPLRISRLEKGQTQADLLIFAPDAERKFRGLPASAFRQAPALEVNASDIAAMQKDWAGFLDQGPALAKSAEVVTTPKIMMQRWQLKGRSSNFTQDVRVQ